MNKIISCYIFYNDDELDNFFEYILNYYYINHRYDDEYNILVQELKKNNITKNKFLHDYRNLIVENVGGYCVYIYSNDKIINIIQSIDYRKYNFTPSDNFFGCVYQVYFKTKKEYLKYFSYCIYTNEEIISNMNKSNIILLDNWSLDEDSNETLYNEKRHFCISVDLKKYNENIINKIIDYSKDNKTTLINKYKKLIINNCNDMIEL